VAGRVRHDAGPDGPPHGRIEQRPGSGRYDIGYHPFIDEQGRVYEGRWSGTDQVPAFDPASQGLATAGHIYGYNTGNLGVCLLGNFTTQQATPAARAALVTVLASLGRVCRIDPESVITYVGPTGNTRTVLGVSGHRDRAATECPGNSFYPQLPAVRSEVAALLASSPADPGPEHVGHSITQPIIQPVANPHTHPPKGSQTDAVATGALHTPQWTR
jgi:hypothetical protein